MSQDTQFSPNQAQQIVRLQTQFNQGLDANWPHAPTLPRDDMAAVIVELGERYERGSNDLCCGCWLVFVAFELSDSLLS